MTFSPDIIFSFFTLSGTLWSILGVTAVIFVGYSVILLYHWFRYAFASPLTFLFLTIYFGISAVLFGVLLTATLIA